MRWPLGVRDLAALLEQLHDDGRRGQHEAGAGDEGLRDRKAAGQADAGQQQRRRRRPAARRGRRSRGASPTAATAAFPAR